MSGRAEAEPTEEGLVGLGEIRAAAERLRGVPRRTPLHPTELVPSGAGSRRAAGEDGGGPAGEPVWLKCENLQRGGAFKVRGAYNFVHRLSPDEREAGLVTFSSGNHAQGVAYAAREFGLEAVIVMPEDAPEVKRDATRALGGRVVFEGYTTEERRARALELAREEGYTVVPPFDHRDIIAGQGTVGLEIVQQLREDARRRGGDPDAPSARPGLVVVPIGGGGLLSGTAAALGGLEPACRVVGVEPEGAASMRASLDAGEPVTLDEVDSVADGLKPVRPGDATFRHVRELVDDVVTVTDEAIRRATLWCAGEHLVVEPSGAATVAALASGRVPGFPQGADGGAAVAVLSGGNVEPELLGRWLVES